MLKLNTNLERLNGYTRSIGSAAPPNLLWEKSSSRSLGNVWLLREQSYSPSWVFSKRTDPLNSLTIATKPLPLILHFLSTKRLSTALSFARPKTDRHTLSMLIGHIPWLLRKGQPKGYLSQMQQWPAHLECKKKDRGPANIHQLGREVINCLPSIPPMLAPVFGASMPLPLM